jgi:hypothetical protein
MHIALRLVDAIHVEQMTAASRRNMMHLLRTQIKYIFKVFFVAISSITHITVRISFGFILVLQCQSDFVVDFY